MTVPFRLLFGKATLLAALAPNAGGALLVDLIAHVLVLKGNLNIVIVLMNRVYWLVLHKVHGNVEFVLPYVKLDKLVRVRNRFYDHGALEIVHKVYLYLDHSL